MYSVNLYPERDLDIYSSFTFKEMVNFYSKNFSNVMPTTVQAAKLEPNQMSARYAIAVHRVKDAERSQLSSEQLFWAANEMATILKEGDPAVIDLPITWAGLAMAHKAQHEIAAAFETVQMDLDEAEGRAICTLKQVIFLYTF